jgi:hypothetical protein
MVGEVPVERLLQLADLGAQPHPGHLGQHLRVAVPGDQGGHSVAAGHPEDVRCDDGQLDLGFEQLLGPVLLRRTRGHQIDPGVEDDPRSR